MARNLTSNHQIDLYIQKAIADAHHHAPQVEHVILPLSKAVRARVKLGSDTIKAFERDGNLGRTCWVTINNKRYCFSFNYRTGMIDLRDRSTQGSLRFDFDNKTSQAAINAQAKAL